MALRSTVTIPAPARILPAAGSSQPCPSGTCRSLREPPPRPPSRGWPLSDARSLWLYRAPSRLSLGHLCRATPAQSISVRHLPPPQVLFQIRSPRNTGHKSLPQKQQLGGCPKPGRCPTRRPAGPCHLRSKWTQNSSLSFRNSAYVGEQTVVFQESNVPPKLLDCSQLCRYLGVRELLGGERKGLPSVAGNAVQETLPPAACKSGKVPGEKRGERCWE